jgi:hypothetical protein
MSGRIGRIERLLREKCHELEKRAVWLIDVKIVYGDGD